MCTYTHTHTHTHTQNGILLSHRKNEIMPFVATQMDPEIAILSEVSQRKTSIIWYYLCMESKNWYKWTYSQNRNRPIDIENKFTVTKGGRGLN